jgi:hypothetical protein
MEQVRIAPIPTEISIILSGDIVYLPKDLRAKIEHHWEELIARNPSLHNGEVFTVTSARDEGNRLDITLSETNYAHYLYSQQIGDLGEYTVRIIHPAVLVVSSDNKYIFGVMGEYTSRPGVIQCCGGGIDHTDIKNGKVDIEHVITKELSEELGVDAYDRSRVKDFHAAFLKTGGPTGKMTISYILRVDQTSLEFMADYNKFINSLRKVGKEPEFGKLFCIDGKSETLNSFIAEHSKSMNEYMATLLLGAHQELYDDSSVLQV